MRKVERATRRQGRVPAAQLQWLWRLYQILYRAQQLHDASRRVPGRTACNWPVWGKHLLQPLRRERNTVPADRRAAAVDAMLDAAHDEVRRLGRKRRLLEAARQFLLDAAAASPLDAEAVRDRRVHIAKELAQLDRLQAAGLSPDVDLLYQARQAQGRGDRPRLIAALSAIEAGAIEGGGPQLARLANRALDHAWGGTGHVPVFRGGPDRVHRAVARPADQRLGAPEDPGGVSPGPGERARAACRLGRSDRRRVRREAGAVQRSARPWR